MHYLTIWKKRMMQLSHFIARQNKKNTKYGNHIYRDIKKMTNFADNDGNRHRGCPKMKL